MKRGCAVLMTLASACLASLPAQAAVAPAPVIAAKAYALIDVTSQQWLATENADARADPASLTKIMTAYIVFQALADKRLKLEQTVPVSQYAWKAIGSRMFIDPTQTVTVRDLISGMIIQSGNDASIALAEAVSGTEAAFVAAMNKAANQIGLKNTHFTNSTGLPDPQHYSTARDMAILAARLIHDFPNDYAIYKQHEFTWNRITQANRNRLLWIDPTVDGMKTGHTESAGFCLVASSRRGARRLLSVVLGTASDNARAQESLKLLNWGFQNWDTVQLYKKNEAIATPTLWKGQAGKVRLGFLDDVFVTLPKGDAARLKRDLQRPDPLMAPLRAGQVVGTLKVSLDGRAIRDIPVVSLDTVERSGIFGSAWDALRLWFK